MNHLYYAALRGVGNDAQHQVRRYLHPYEGFFRTAKEALLRSKPMLGWRKANQEEAALFEESRSQPKPAHRFGNKKRRRDQRETIESKGVWVILEAPPQNPEEPEETFEAFFKAKEVYDEMDCPRQRAIKILATYDEANALLLESLPEPYQFKEKKERLLLNTTGEAKQFLWLRVDTNVLEQQRLAVQKLRNTPQQHLSPLVKLMTAKPIWLNVDPQPLAEEDWVFLKTPQERTLKDGTEEQRQFVRIALGTQDFALLEGPPGSGKTTAICELIVQMLKEKKRVLLVASTHVAVDNVLERLIEWQDQLQEQEKPLLPVRIGNEEKVTSDLLKPFTLQALAETWKSDLMDFLENPDVGTPQGKEARRMLFAALKKETPSDSALLRLILDSSNLVCGTTIGILQHPFIKNARYQKEATSFRPFDMMVLDEASKTTWTEFLVPALYASKWAIIGDIRQLSPYVEEANLTENLRLLIPPFEARAAAHCFHAKLNSAKSAGFGLRSLFSVNDEEKEILQRECQEREIESFCFDDAQPTDVLGCSGIYPDLLWKPIVMGRPETLLEYEERLPIDLFGEGSEMPELDRWHAAKKAYFNDLVKKKKRPNAASSSVEQLRWEKEMAWRLVRAYELRRNESEQQRLTQEIEALLPRSLGASTAKSRVTNTQRAEATPKNPQEATQRIDTLRCVMMPSILELLQVGFEKLPDQNKEVALTDGLPPAALEQRIVSLCYQHRMHPNISQYPREAFYSSPAQAESTSPDGVAFSLLLDASDMLQKRQWTYERYSSRAHWLNVNPKQESSNNTNKDEVKVIQEELQHFVSWAKSTPRQTPEGQAPYKVAVLTFYRGQEWMLRNMLRQESGLHGNTRNFRFPKKDPVVEVTLCTVDRFQGHEADLVFLSFVKTRSVGFLNSPNRLNVGLTRARYQLVLVGNQTFFSSEKCRSEIIKKLATSSCYTNDLTWRVP